MLSKIKNNIKSDVFVLLLGTFVSQLIPFLASFYLTRIYSPASFGLFAFYFGILMIMNVVITMKYELAVLLPEKDEDSINIVALCFIFSLTIGLVTSFIMFSVKTFTNLLDENVSFLIVVVILPLNLMVLGFSQTLYYWNNRKKNFKFIASNRVLRSLFAVVFSIAFAFTSFSNDGLILGDFIGQFIAFTIIISFNFKKYRSLLTEISTVRIKSMSSKFKDFPKFSILSNLLEKISGNLPILLLTNFFGETEIGYFSLSQRTISVPGSIVSQSIGDIFRQKASEKYVKDGECSTIFDSTAKKLFFLAIIPFAVLGVFAPDLFSIFFGVEWYKSGVYVQLLIFMFFLQFISSPLSSMFIVAQKQKIDLYFQILLLFGVILVILLGKSYFNSFKVTILLFGLVYSIKYIFEFIYSRKFSNGKNGK